MIARVLCVGAPTYDTIFRVQAIPSSPTKVLATAVTQLAGGMAASGGTAIARLGGRVTYWARVGADDTGSRITADLSAAGLDLTQVRRVPGGRSTLCTILVDDEGGRMVIPFYDPDLDPDPSWLPLEEIEHFDAVLVDTRWTAGAASVLAAAKSAGVRAVLDADISPAGVLEALAPLASHVVFSELALSEFTKRTDIDQALHATTASLPDFAGVTLGARGFRWREQGTIHSEPAPTVAVVDTLSAGDVFHGAFTLALAEHMTIADAGRFASAAAALKCTRSGGRSGAPTRREVEELLNR